MVRRLWGDLRVLLGSVYVRFFRSFNFDYLRQDKDGVDRFPWDTLPEEPDAFYPYVKVDLEDDITTVVGANEAGKSQLIVAIQCLLGDRAISPKGFCRYSQFFGVRGTMPLPQFGGRFTHLNEQDLQALQALLGAPFTSSEFWMFRADSSPRIYWRDQAGWSERHLTPEELAALPLPVARRIDADVALPASVSLYDLVGGARAPHPRGRADWYGIYRALKAGEDTYPSTADTIASLLPVPPVRPPKEAAAAGKSLDLVRDLLVKVADVDQRAFSELLAAGDADDGYSEAITSSISDAVAVSLNFPHWWSQDRDFALEVHKDGFFLVLTMRDRTGQTYTFDERSGGMKYFLSYFVQYQAYGPRVPGRQEILLMDEPDAFLSTQGQQDLLKVLTSYAYPDNDTQPAQVLYVTHSPFLIDKNHPQRIRVLQKGYDDEGTRIVPKAATEKYEPLRSAFGSFHADTAFIGTCNLLVEGPADLALFSGVSAAMRQDGYQGANLDLNALTMVPVHGSTQYRYTLHLTRGRDLDRPAVVVLLDSDPAGQAALEDLEKGYGDADIVDPRLILPIGSIDFRPGNLSVEQVHEPEDLVPSAVALQIVARFAKDVLAPEAASAVIAELPAELKVSKSQRVFDVAAEAARTASGSIARPLVLGKIEFARTLGAIASDLRPDDREALYSNFSTLFQEIVVRQDLSTQLANQDRLTHVTRRLVERFRRDHRARAQKITVERFLREVEHHLVGSGAEEESVRRVVREIRERFNLHESPLDDVDDFAGLKKRLGDLIYNAVRSQTS